MIAEAVRFLPQIAVALLGAFVVALLAVFGAAVFQTGGLRSVAPKTGLLATVATFIAALLLVAVISIVFTAATLAAVGYAGIAHGVDINLVNGQERDLYPIAIFAFAIPGFVSILLAIGRGRPLLTMAQLFMYSAIAAFVEAGVVSSGFGMPHQMDEFTRYPSFEVATVVFPATVALMLTLVGWLSLARPLAIKS